MAAQGVDFGFCEDLNPMMAEQGSGNTGANMFAAAETPIIDKAATARRASVNQQGKPAIVLACRF
jgi:hypothetical protein